MFSIHPRVSSHSKNFGNTDFADRFTRQESSIWVCWPQKIRSDHLFHSESIPFLHSCGNVFISLIKMCWHLQHEASPSLCAPRVWRRKKQTKQTQHSLQSCTENLALMEIRCRVCIVILSTKCGEWIILGNDRSLNRFPNCGFCKI